MPLGVNIDAAVLRGQRRKRARTRQITVPYAPTPRGEFAETQARKEGHVHGGYTHPILGRAPTKSTGDIDLGSTASSLVDALRGLDSSGYPGSIGNVNPVRDLAENEAKNILDVAKSNYPDVFGGQADIRHVLPHLPDEKELQAGGAILSAVPVEKALEGTEAAARLAKVLSGAEKADEASPAARAARALAGGSGRRAVGRVAAKLEPDSVKAAREAIAEKAAALPKPVRTAAKVAGRVLSAPVKRPITAPLALQAPAAALHGNPAEFLKALEGKGEFADISNTLAGAASHISPIAGEAVDLPETVLPSTFLAGKSGVEAAQGHPKNLDALLSEWKKTGLLPALASGNPSEALKALEKHPLFAGLEASGALSAVGRGAGAAAREISGGRFGGVERPDLSIKGYPNVSVKRRYSRDLIRQGAQRIHDERTGNEIDTGTNKGKRRAEKVLKEASDRFSGNQEAIRRLHKHEDLRALKGSLPHKTVLGIGKKLDHASAEVVSEAVERIIKHPSSFHQDLSDYKRRLDDVYENGDLDKAQKQANRQLAKQVDKGLKRGSPEDVVDAANHFTEIQQPILDQLVEHGILDKDQAAKASAIPFARIHMGAGYDEAHGVVDAQGKPLSLEQIKTEMERQGVEPPGFLSHRTPGSGDFYSPWGPDRASLKKGARTGESVASGSQLGGVDALVRQLSRSRGLLDRVHAFDGFVSRFGVDLRGHGVENMSDAQRVLRDPARYGLDEGIKWVPVRRYPFTASKEQMADALEHQDPVVASEGVLSRALDDATTNGGPDGPVVFMPKQVVDQMRKQFEQMGIGMKRVQAATTGFKRAVLPFSPGFFYGNAFDNMIRTGLAGINPAHLALGLKVSKDLSPEERSQILSGAHYSSVDQLAAHRTAETLFEGHKHYEVAARAVARWRHKRGINLLPNAVSKTSDALLSFNAATTEMLPQYGALGKIALDDFRATKGSWMKALFSQKTIAEDFKKGIADPDKLTRYQKEIEQVYGNYTHMGPEARKFWSNVAPFWTWMRAAYKFVYLTLPAHHPIQTAILSAAAQMTQKEREKFGLDKLGKEPVPGWLQGGLPLAGGIAPVGKYNSFGYAGNPLEAVTGAVIPQAHGVLEALAGRDWKGDALEGGEAAKLGTALEELAGSFVPGWNFVLSEGVKHPKLNTGSLNPLRTEPKSTVEYLREPKQQITVPISGSSSGSSGGAPWKSSGSSSSGTAPWKSGPSSSGKAPWK